MWYYWQRKYEFWTEGLRGGRKCWTENADEISGVTKLQKSDQELQAVRCEAFVRQLWIFTLRSVNHTARYNAFSADTTFLKNPL